MAQLLYFIPGVHTAGPALQAELGLDHTLGPGVTWGAIDRGPNDLGAGCLLAAASPDRPRLTVGERTWYPAGPEKPYWIGLDPAAPPTEADLRRDGFPLIAGADVELADGRPWHIPIARFFDGRTNCPVLWGLDHTTGELAERLDPAGQVFWDLAAEFLTAYAGLRAGELANSETDAAAGRIPSDPPAAGIAYTRVLEIATAALAVNYRVGRFEILALELLASDTALAVCKVFSDFAGLEALMTRAADQQKKNIPGSTPAA